MPSNRGPTDIGSQVNDSLATSPLMPEMAQSRGYQRPKVYKGTAGFQDKQLTSHKLLKGKTSICHRPDNIICQWTLRSVGLSRHRLPLPSQWAPMPEGAEEKKFLKPYSSLWNMLPSHRAPMPERPIEAESFPRQKGY